MGFNRNLIADRLVRSGRANFIPISDPVEDCTDERAYIIVDKKAFGPFCPAKRRKRRDFRFDSSKSFYQPVFLKSAEPTISSFPASPGPTPSKYINPSQKPELFGDSFSVSGLHSGQKHGCKFIRLFFGLKTDPKIKSVIDFRHIEYFLIDPTFH